jgi:hypothetical protein
MADSSIYLNNILAGKKKQETKDMNFETYFLKYILFFEAC